MLAIFHQDSSPRVVIYCTWRTIDLSFYAELLSMDLLERLAQSVNFIISLLFPFHWNFSAVWFHVFVILYSYVEQGGSGAIRLGWIS